MQTLAKQLSNQFSYDVRELTHDDEDQIYHLQKQHKAFFRKLQEQVSHSVARHREANCYL